MRLEQSDGDFCIDAALLAQLLDEPPARVRELMRAREITSVCERGEGEHAGRYRLTFFAKSRRIRLEVDSTGLVLRHSTVDFGDRLLPRGVRRSGQ